MYFILYLSAGANWFTEPELNALLETCTKNNTLIGISGMLLYANGNFIQLLEGEESVVQQLYKKISMDQRHKGITPIASGPLEKRNFPPWAMGFKAIGPVSNTPFKDYLNPVNDPANNNPNSHLAIKMLNAFIKTARM